MLSNSGPITVEANQCGPPIGCKVKRESGAFWTSFLPVCVGGGEPAARQHPIASLRVQYINCLHLAIFQTPHHGILKLNVEHFRIHDTALHPSRRYTKCLA